MFLKGTLNGESEVVAHNCVEALQSENIIEKILDWTPDDLPGDQKKKVSTLYIETVVQPLAT